MENDFLTQCPICLGSTSISGASPTCECCHAPLPPLYLKEAHGMLPLHIQFFGLPGHGKTTYLAALTMALQRVNGAWSGFTMMPATEPSQRLVRTARTYFATGRLPPPSRPGDRDVHVLLLNRIPIWIRAAMTIRDCSGQAFQEIDVDLQEASLLLKAPITFLFISLEDFNDSGGYALDSLMTNYLSTLAAHDVRLDKEGRKIVVVLTKADLFWEQLPEELVDYIREDPIWAACREEGRPSKPYSLAEMTSYLEDMDRMSQVIEGWICQSAAGRMFVNLAGDNNIAVQFSIVSSTGAAPRAQDNVLATSWDPARVLDPLLWALELASGRRRSSSR